MPLNTVICSLPCITHTHDTHTTHTPHTHTHTHTPSRMQTHAQLVALLALALVAGYSSTAIIHCPQDPTGFTDTTITTSYPFQQYIKFNASSSSVTTPSSGTVIRTPPKAYPLDPSISQSAQFFVAWGSLTLIYGVVALLVYMCVTANEQLQQVFDFLVYCVSQV